jgi:DNA-binding NarL/FixJ family response regulator
MQPMRFLIVDDHPLFLEALEMALAVAFPGAQVETAGSIGGARRILAEGARPDLILLDLKMPDTAGFEGVVSMRAANPRIPLCIISSMSGEDYFPEVAGAAGPTGAAAPNRRELEILARLRELTPQQYKVLSLICEGKLNKQIAYELDIVETTVKAHITSIFKKLSIHNRTQAVLIMQKLKLQGLIVDHQDGFPGEEHRHAG